MVGALREPGRSERLCHDARWDGAALLQRITCPTLLLQADTKLGGLMSDSDVALAKQLLAHPVHVRFDTLGHGLYMQNPEPVLRAVTNFLDSLAV